MKIYWKMADFDTIRRQVALQMCYASSFSARNGEVQFWSFFATLKNKNSHSTGFCSMGIEQKPVEWEFLFLEP